MKRTPLAIAVLAAIFAAGAVEAQPVAAPKAAAAASGKTLYPQSQFDVMLKERRRLVLVPREAPLSDIHLEHMLRLSRMGAVIFPPVPAFYQRPVTTIWEIPQDADILPLPVTSLLIWVLG